MANYKAKAGYDLEWFTREERSMTGIGGSTKSTGTRKLYASAWEIISTEIADSNAPLLLSLQAQQDLGLVLDLAECAIYWC